MQQFITILKPTRPGMLVEGPTSFEEQAVSEHFAYLEERTRVGIVLLAGRTLTEDESTFVGRSKSVSPPLESTLRRKKSPS